MTCLNCSATITNGLTLCALCQTKATTDLQLIPIYHRNLSRWEPGRSGGRQVPTSRPPAGERLDGGDQVTQALDDASLMLAGLLLALGVSADGLLKVDSEFIHASVTPDIVDMCSFLERNMSKLAALPGAGDAVTAIGKAEARLAALTRRVAPGWYAGACRRCKKATYVIPGLSWLTCGGCGTTSFARDHLDLIIGEARGWIARPRQLAAAIVALTDEPSVDQLYESIRNWGKRGHLADHSSHRYSPKTHRLGDVLDRIHARKAEEEARAKRKAEEAARIQVSPVPSVTTDPNQVCEAFPDLASSGA